jgi:hypothetical protein
MEGDTGLEPVRDDFKGRRLKPTWLIPYNGRRGGIRTHSAETTDLQSALALHL